MDRPGGQGEIDTTLEREKSQGATRRRVRWPPAPAPQPGDWNLRQLYMDAGHGSLDKMNFGGATRGPVHKSPLSHHHGDRGGPGSANVVGAIASSGGEVSRGRLRRPVLSHHHGDRGPTFVDASGSMDAYLGEATRGRVHRMAPSQHHADRGSTFEDAGESMVACAGTISEESGGSGETPRSFVERRPAIAHLIGDWKKYPEAVELQAKAELYLKLANDFRQDREFTLRKLQSMEEELAAGRKKIAALTNANAALEAKLRGAIVPH